MAAASYDIQVDQGSTFEVLMSFLNDGTEFPVASTQLRGEVKNSVFDSTKGFPMMFVQVTPSSVKATIPDEISSMLDFEKGVYDIVLDFPDGSSRRILQGSVDISLGVTLP